MSRTQDFRASAAFPVERDERFIVRGVGGEPDEHWHVQYVNRGKDSTTFRVNIEERRSPQ